MGVNLVVYFFLSYNRLNVYLLYSLALFIHFICFFILYFIAYKLKL